MNKAVIKVLAKQRVKFQEKIGLPISLEMAIEFETKKLTKLSRENNFPY
tara:strand:+ start:105 stop:251 length:147 start_codon:yes stop_codon:yes gene_type:complete